MGVANHLICLGACAALLAVAPSAVASGIVTYDVVAEFALSNPSGVWSYGYGYPYTGIPGWVGPLWQPGNNGSFIWWSVGTYPYVERNLTGGTVYGSNDALPADHLVVVPADRASIVVRFTAPEPGYYTFSGDFMQLEYYSIVPSWEGALVTSGGTATLAFSGSLGGYGYWGEKVPIAFSENLAQGDTVDFFVWANWNNWGDDSGLKLSVNGVTGTPEPGSLWLAALALLAVGSYKRTRYF